MFFNGINNVVHPTPLSNSRTILESPKEILYPLAVILPRPCFQLLETTNLLSVSMEFPIQDISDKRNPIIYRYIYYIPFFARLHTLHIFSSLIHAVACMSTSFIFYGWIKQWIVWIFCILCIHSSVYEHLFPLFWL